ncbi:APC family permease [Jongsikchunia kroppenstedtii]|uniref:APC family permease n=1 Tax=Jongsikchunia kroppenstedtii TaxID=1121721 RepID=UPI0003762E43|nr:APC family permease [Jongsikchunia kroppenstedtii]
MATGIESPAPQQHVDLDGSKLDRGVGFWGLLWASEGSLIGSGWLFGALTAASIAGPSAIIAWIIASIIVILLALVHAELGGMFAVSGGTSRFPHYAFGGFAGAAFGWFSYIQAATVAPIEVLAAIQYMSTASWASGLYNGSDNTLTASGVWMAVALMVFFVILNLVGVRWLSRFNSTLTIWKVGLPILAVIVLMAVSFHSHNFSAGGGFFVHGAELKSILIAIPSGGIVFAMLGFEQAVQLGGEARNPSRDLPLAVITSILLAAVLFVLIQVAFIGALEPKLLAEAHTWTNLSDATMMKQNPDLEALNKGPFWQVATLAGLGWLAVLLRIDAVLSPGGTGLIYVTTSSRLTFGLSRNGYLPRAFEWTSGRSRVPWFGVLVTAAIGLLFLLPFPSWSKLVGVVTSASVMMYAGAPLAFGALRLQKPDLPRPYRLPWGPVLAPVAFIFANFIVYWSGWQTYTTLMAVMVIGAILIGVSMALKLNPAMPEMDWQGAIWVLPYLVGMGVISYFGGFGEGGIIGGVGVFSDVWVGGRGALGLWWDMLALAVFSLVIYYGAMRYRLAPQKVDEMIAAVHVEPVEGH